MLNMKDLREYCFGDNNHSAEWLEYHQPFADDVPKSVRRAVKEYLSAKPGTEKCQKAMKRLRKLCA